MTHQTATSPAAPDASPAEVKAILRKYRRRKRTADQRDFDRALAVLFGLALAIEGEADMLNNRPRGSGLTADERETVQDVNECLVALTWMTGHLRQLVESYSPRGVEDAGARLAQRLEDVIAEFCPADPNR